MRLPEAVEVHDVRYGAQIQLVQTGIAPNAYTGLAKECFDRPQGAIQAADALHRRRLEEADCQHLRLGSGVPVQPLVGVHHRVERELVVDKAARPGCDSGQMRAVGEAARESARVVCEQNGSIVE